MYITMLPVINDLIDAHEESISMLHERVKDLDLTEAEQIMANELINQTNETVTDLHALKGEIRRYEKDNDR